MVSPIVIPSKGRPATLLPKVLAGLQVFVVVEPQDEPAYPQELNLIVLPENDQGICFVRNFVLDEAARRGWVSFWMMDDDIKDFTKTVDNRLQKCDPLEVLQPAELHFRQRKAAQGALEYRPFGWLGKELNMNTYCDVCVWFDSSQIAGFRYDPEVTLKEDRDFTIQLLQAGKTTCRYSNGSFNTPSNASNKGGLHEVYKSGREVVAVQAMCRKWPHICRQITKPNGRIDCDIDWKAARSNAVQMQLC